MLIACDKVATQVALRCTPGAVTEIPTGYVRSLSALRPYVPSWAIAVFSDRLVLGQLHGAIQAPSLRTEAECALMHVLLQVVHPQIRQTIEMRLH